MEIAACDYRKVSEDGRIQCAKIAQGDKEVSPGLCAACPAQSIACQSLRFTLRKEAGGSVVVRYGNGKSLLLDDRPPALSLGRAACAATVTPIASAADCASCSLRQDTGRQATARPAAAQVVGRVIPFPVAAHGR